MARETANTHTTARTAGLIVVIRCETDHIDTAESHTCRTSAGSRPPSNEQTIIPSAPHGAAGPVARLPIP